MMKHNESSRNWCCQRLKKQTTVLNATQRHTMITTRLLHYFLPTARETKVFNGARLLPASVSWDQHSHVTVRLVCFVKIVNRWVIWWACGSSWAKPGQSCDYNILTTKCHQEFGAIHLVRKFEERKLIFFFSLPVLSYMISWYHTSLLLMRTIWFHHRVTVCISTQRVLSCAVPLGGARLGSQS